MSAVSDVATSDNLRRTAAHEAAHWIAGQWLGVPLDHATVLGTKTNYGHVMPKAWPEDGRGLVIMLLAGRLFFNEPGWPPPFTEAVAERRESLGKTLVRYNIGPDVYRGLVAEARALVELPPFRRAVGRTADELLERGVLLAES